MDFHSEDHLQPARAAPTAGSRQPLLPGVPLHHRRLRNGRNKLDKLSRSRDQEGRSHSGFNFFDSGEEALFCAIIRGEFNIGGLQNKSSRRFLSDKNSGPVTRLLKRLRLRGLIRKVAHGYKYYLTQFGKQVSTTGLKLRELVIIPSSPSDKLLNQKFSARSAQNLNGEVLTFWQSAELSQSR